MVSDNQEYLQHEFCCVHSKVPTKCGCCHKMVWSWKITGAKKCLVCKQTWHPSCASSEGRHHLCPTKAAPSSAHTSTTSTGSSFSSRIQSTSTSTAAILQKGKMALHHKSFVPHSPFSYDSLASAFNETESPPHSARDYTPTEKVFGEEEKRRSMTDPVPVAFPVPSKPLPVPPSSFSRSPTALPPAFTPSLVLPPAPLRQDSRILSWPGV